jgi:hypothetical protein
MQTRTTPTKTFAALFTAVGWMQQLDNNPKVFIRNARPGNRKGIRQQSAVRSSLTPGRFWFLTVSIVLALLRICATELSNEEHHEYLASPEHMKWMSALPEEAHGKYVGHWPHVAAGSASLRQSVFEPSFPPLDFPYFSKNCVSVGVALRILSPITHRSFCPTLQTGGKGALQSPLEQCQTSLHQLT